VTEAATSAWTSARSRHRQLGALCKRRAVRQREPHAVQVLSERRVCWLSLGAHEVFDEHRRPRSPIPRPHLWPQPLGSAGDVGAGVTVDLRRHEDDLPVPNVLHAQAADAVAPVRQCVRRVRVLLLRWQAVAHLFRPARRRRMSAGHRLAIYGGGAPPREAPTSAFGWTGRTASRHDERGRGSHWHHGPLQCHAASIRRSAPIARWRPRCRIGKAGTARLSQAESPAAPS
jgi:hypothetical protein